MIIFGSRTKTALVALLFFTCGICQGEAAQRLIRVRTWFTLFFVPVFPFGHGKYVLKCAYCGGESILTRENADKFIADYEKLAAEHQAAESIEAE
jgi:hypothetical protein